jgi:hypothetical protein
VVYLNLMNPDTNTWAETSSVSHDTFAATHHSSGVKSLSAALTKVRLTISNVGDQFDAGKVNVMCE